MAGGGAGDLIYCYFMGKEHRLIRPVKEKFKNIMITAVYACHVGSEYELGFLNPNIDSSLIYKWYPPGHLKENEWKQMVNGEDILSFARKNKITPDDYTELFLSEKEKKIFAEIATEPYIAVHPFAGLPHRGCKKHPYTGTYRCYPDYKYTETIKILSQKYRIIVMGKTNTSYDTLRATEETLDVTGLSNVINMIDKGSLRMNTYLCRNAAGFLGTHSSMLSAAWTNDVPSVFFYPAWEEGAYKSVKNHGGTTGTWALDKSFHSYYEMKPEEFVNTLTPEEVANKLLENIKKK
jgi:ADP-heptose:LPS heptosyltransferase